MRFKNDATLRHMTVAARNEAQAKKLVRAHCAAPKIESVKKYGWVLAPFVGW
jgi:hypothetical protein